MIRHGRLAVLLTAFLIACDEPTVISNVDRLPGLSGTDLWSMQDSAGIPVEIHGTPFPGISAADVAAALRAPASLAEGIKFHATEIGSWQSGHAARLVLHFNPAGPPNAVIDCRRTEPSVTGPVVDGAFTVNAAFCREDAWQAHGFMTVLRIEPGDMAAFTDAMRALFLAILREEPDR